MPINLGKFGEQRSFEVIPANTKCSLQLAIKPGGAAEGGWLTRAKDGCSSHLAVELTVLDGPHAKRKFWEQFTVEGDPIKHETSMKIAGEVLRAIVESARGISPKDKSEAAERLRHLDSWGDMDQLRFPARLHVEQPKNGYAAKNKIGEVITPDQQQWNKLDQVDRASIVRPTNTAAPAPLTLSQNGDGKTSTGIARPEWAK